MKVLALLCLLSMIQFSCSLDVDMVFDVMDDCDVELGDFQCLEDAALDLMDNMDARMDIDIDFDAVQAALEGCGFTFGPDSLECLKSHAPDS